MYKTRRLPEAFLDTKEGRFAELRRICPTVRESFLVSAAQIPLRPHNVFVMVQEGSTSIDDCLTNLYARPWFNRTVALQKSTSQSYIDSLLWKHEELRILPYPDCMAGNLHEIRKFIEERTSCGDIISDDDPGDYKKDGKDYFFIPATTTYMADPAISKCGAHRIRTTAKYLNFGWHVAIKAAKMAAVAQVGLNASRERATALKGWELPCCSKPRRSFAPYIQRPFKYNCAVVNACAILQPVRHLVPEELRDIRQEWAVASAAAREMGLGTMLFMPILVEFAIRPPKNSDEEIAKMRRFYDFVKPGNSGHGKGENKTTTVIQFEGAFSTDKPKRIIRARQYENCTTGA